MNVRRPAFRRVLPLGIIAIGLILLFGLFQNITTRLADLREAPNDNLSWTLSQVEVEVLLLSDATALVGQDPARLQDVRRRFDNLYSRVSLLRQSNVFGEMRLDQDFSSQLSELEVGIKSLVGLIDGADNELLNDIPKLQKDLRDIRGLAHDIALTGIRLNANDTDAERADFSNLLITAALISATLIGLLVVFSYFLFRQHKKAENASKAIEQANSRLKSSFVTSLDAIVVANSKGEIVEFNKAAEVVFGYTANQAIGATMADLIIPPQYRDAHNAGMKRFNETKEARLVGKGRIEITALRQNGEEFQIEIAVGHSEDDNGSLFVAYIRDITERLAAEEELRIARDKALEAGKAKTNFLAVMSHEMRTPLNGLFGTIELLQETKLSKKQSEYLGLAKSSSDILLHHVNDVLDVSRLDAAKMELTPVSFDLKTFFENVITTNQTTAYATKNQLILNLDGMPKQNVWMDDHRLRQIAYNLISNALKFTSGGQVTVQASVTEQSDLVFSVSDTGIGISDEDISHVFEEFYTQDKSYDRLASGTGLGLAICKRIVGLMKGEIFVSSELGKGTTFTVSVPLSLDTAAPIHSDKAVDVYDPEALKARNILLVEDNDINRHIVREMLEKNGVDISEARNGAEAVEMAALIKYDLILMDVSMPVMNGVDATKTIRKSNGLSAAVPILGLTAHALPTEQEKFLASGMNACVCKPVSHQDLVLNIENLLNNAPSENSGLIQEHNATYLNRIIVSDVKNALGEDKLHKILGDFQNEIDGLIDVIPTLLEDDNFTELAAVVHKSVGSSSILGTEYLQEVLRAIEDAAKTNAKERIDEKYSDLPDIWKITQSHLKDL